MSASNNILLESGTNEVEMLEFLLDEQSFGVNVAKVISIIQYEDRLLTSIPEAPPEIMGTFMFRDTPIPLIGLSNALHRTKKKENSRPLVISVEFNDFTCGLFVDGVERIHRVSWDRFVPINDSFSSTMNANSILGTIHIDEKDVLIIDIESIATHLFSGLSMEEKAHEVGEFLEEDHAQRHKVNIVLAEDSAFIRKNITTVLNGAGYTGLAVFENGAKAEAHILSLIAADSRPDVVISDIEMPVMDGLALCKKIKTDFGLEDVPVIMFSSLINDQMRLKCEGVGADACITKPEIGELVELIDKLCEINAE